MERTMVSSKLSPENTEFLDAWARRFKPYEVSQSFLLDLAMRIVRHLEINGKISLEPAALQVLLGTNGTSSTSSTTEKKRGKQVPHA